MNLQDNYATSMLVAMRYGGPPFDTSKLPTWDEYEKKEMLWYKKQQAAQADDANDEDTGAPHTEAMEKGVCKNALLWLCLPPSCSCSGLVGGNLGCGFASLDMLLCGLVC